MIYVHAAQGSKAWKKARAGVITASIFKSVSSGKLTDTQRNTAFGLACERLSGEPLDEGHTGWAAQRGHDLEPDARLAHQEHLNVYVKPVGFAVMADDWWYGASADGLIGEDGGAEYKCFVNPELLRALIIDGDFREIEHQAQGCMWVTGRKWWDMCLYCPALAVCGQEFTRRRIQRDDDFIEQMVDGLELFRRQVEAYEIELRDRAARQHIVIPSITEMRAHLIN
jgi:YqaJ-like viral recombinase domain